jgi:hypothetical protein
LSLKHNNLSPYHIAITHWVTQYNHIAAMHRPGGTGIPDRSNIMKYTNREIAENLTLWNEYFNADATMSDEEFESMPIDQRLALLDEAFGKDPELTTRAKMLLNNSLEWYVVTLADGGHELRHQSALSSILECGEEPGQFGIVNYEQCWNGEDLTTEDDWV